MCVSVHVNARACVFVCVYVSMCLCVCLCVGARVLVYVRTCLSGRKDIETNDYEDVIAKEAVNPADIDCTFADIGGLDEVCCTVLPCIAVCCCVLPGVAVCCRVLPCCAVCCRVLPCVAVYCHVLQCVAACIV